MALDNLLGTLAGIDRVAIGHPVDAPLLPFLHVDPRAIAYFYLDPFRLVLATSIDGLETEGLAHVPEYIDKPLRALARLHRVAPAGAVLQLPLHLDYPWRTAQDTYTNRKIISNSDELRSPLLDLQLDTLGPVHRPVEKHVPLHPDGSELRLPARPRTDESCHQAEEAEIGLQAPEIKHLA